MEEDNFGSDPHFQAPSTDYGSPNPPSRDLFSVEPPNAATFSVADDDDTLSDYQPVEERYRIDPAEAAHGVSRVHVNNLLRHHELDPSTRHMFTVAAHAKARGVTNDMAELMLEQMAGHHLMLTGEEVPDGTTNIRTAESRLGVHPDDYITRYIACPAHLCWALTPYKDLYSLADPTCNATLDDGSICQEAIYSTINTQRFAYKVIPFTKISLGLSMLLQDEEVVSHLQDWRQNEPRDTFHPHNDTPYNRDEPFWSADSLLHGLSDGSAWRSSRCDRVRTVSSDHVVGTRAIEGVEIQRHSSLPFGLKLIMNLDW